MKHNNLYTANQIAAITGFSITTIYDKINSLKLHPVKTNRKLNYYDEKAFDLIFKLLQTAPKEKSFTKYYPIKIEETFYIYESKINNL